MIAEQTGWDIDKMDAQPDWLLETVYAIILIDKRLIHSNHKQMLKAWSGGK